MIDALILDYGGVVIHEDPADHDAIGVPLGFAPGQLWAATHGIPEYLPSRIGQLSSAQYEAAVRAHLVEVAGPDSANEAVDRLLDHYARNIVMRPVMQPLLAGLRGRVRLALLSNASRGSTAKFVARGLDRVFDLILCSGDVGVAKPDPAAYRLAAGRLQLPLPRCAFVDDVEANVAAARALGMPALHYHHTRHAELLDALRDWGVGD